MKSPTDLAYAATYLRGGIENVLERDRRALVLMLVKRARFFIDPDRARREFEAA